MGPIDLCGEILQRIGEDRSTVFCVMRSMLRCEYARRELSNSECEMTAIEFDVFLCLELLRI